MSLRYAEYRGEEIADVVPDLARLRTQVFRDWPYLYDGDAAYEERYLAGYARPGGFVVGALDGDTLVGAATAMPMLQAEPAFRAALEGTDYTTGATYYLAESVLLARYRGEGAGHAFFDAREAEARAHGMTHAAFCAVMRNPDHLGRPDSYRPLDTFWRNRGYHPITGAVAHFAWRDIGDAEETEKPMQVWGKKL